MSIGLVGGFCNVQLHVIDEFDSVLIPIDTDFIVFVYVFVLVNISIWGHNVLIVAL